MIRSDEFTNSFFNNQANGNLKSFNVIQVNSKLFENGYDWNFSTNKVRKKILFLISPSTLLRSKASLEVPDLEKNKSCYVQSQFWIISVEFPLGVPRSC